MDYFFTGLSLSRNLSDIFVNLLLNMPYSETSPPHWYLVFIDAMCLVKKVPIVLHNISQHFSMISYCMTCMYVCILDDMYIILVYGKMYSTYLYHAEGNYLLFELYLFNWWSHILIYGLYLIDQAACNNGISNHSNEYRESVDHWISQGKCGLSAQSHDWEMMENANVFYVSLTNLSSARVVMT